MKQLPHRLSSIRSDKDKLLHIYYNTFRVPVSRLGQDTGPVDLCGANGGS